MRPGCGAIGFKPDICGSSRRPRCHYGAEILLFAHRSCISVPRGPESADGIASPHRKSPDRCQQVSRCCNGRHSGVGQGVAAKPGVAEFRGHIAWAETMTYGGLPGTPQRPSPSTSVSAGRRSIGISPRTVLLDFPALVHLAHRIARHLPAHAEPSSSTRAALCESSRRSTP